MYPNRYTLAPMHLYREYFKPKVYTIWVRSLELRPGLQLMEAVRGGSAVAESAGPEVRGKALARSRGGLGFRV